MEHHGSVNRVDGAGEQSSSLPPVSAVLLADDLSGSLDSAAQWARLGINVAASLDDGEMGSAELWALNTNTREKSKDQAYQCVRSAAECYAQQIIFKKIDSTFRGHVILEARAVLDSEAFDKALIAPAFPAQGRTVVDGALIVRSGKSAPLRVDLTSALEMGHAGPFRLVGHEVIERGVEAVAQLLNESDKCLLLADSQSDDDLQVLARATQSASCKVLAMGSAGLARQVSGLWVGATQSLSALKQWDGAQSRTGPVLVVAGTHHQTTMDQLWHLSTSGAVELISVETVRLLSDEELAEEKRLVLARAAECLARGRSVAVATGLVGFVKGSALRPAQFLGEVSASLLRRYRVARLCITGGDTCYEVLTRMNVTRLDVVGEVIPGIPVSLIHDGPWAGLPVISKAGGFGSSLSLLEVVA